LNIDLNNLKSISIELPERRLRLPVKLFNIKIRNKIFNLKTLFKINKEVVKNKIKFTISDDIKDILFDTGNELNYSCVSDEIKKNIS